MNSNKSKISCKRGFTLMEQSIGQALPDNAPAKGHLAAFTLIELLVVVLIIGILAAVAVPQYRVAVMKSRYATIKNLVTSIAQAQEVYYLANNEYSDSFELLDVDMPGGKKDDSTSNVYSYDWGKCWISVNQVACARKYKLTDTLSIQYEIRLQHATSDANKRRCIAGGTVDLTSVENKVCKLETEDSSPRKYISDNYTVWTYQ